LEAELNAAAAADAVSSVGLDHTDMLGSMADKDKADGTIEALLLTAQGEVERAPNNEAGESRRDAFVKGA
jgi:hypothetical protein